MHTWLVGLYYYLNLHHIIETVLSDWFYICLPSRFISVRNGWMSTIKLHHITYIISHTYSNRLAAFRTPPYHEASFSVLTQSHLRNQFRSVFGDRVGFTLQKGNKLIHTEFALRGYEREREGGAGATSKRSQWRSSIKWLATIIAVCIIYDFFSS